MYVFEMFVIIVTLMFAYMRVNSTSATLKVIIQSKQQHDFGFMIETIGLDSNKYEHNYHYMI